MKYFLHLCICYLPYYKYLNIPELYEESQQDPVLEGVTYYGRYLGSCSVVKPSGEEATAEAVNTIVQAVRSDGYKLLLIR